MSVSSSECPSATTGSNSHFHNNDPEHNKTCFYCMRYLFKYKKIICRDRFETDALELAKIMHKMDSGISSRVLFRFINIYMKYFDELFLHYEFRLMTIAGITEATEYLLGVIESMIQVDEIKHYVGKLKRKPAEDNIADRPSDKISKKNVDAVIDKKVVDVGKKVVDNGKKVIVLD